MTDSIIYEAQPIPPEDPDDKGRQRRLAVLGGLAVIALLIAGVVLGAALFRGGDETEPLTEPPTSTLQPAPSDGDTPVTTVPGRGPFANRLFPSNADSSESLGGGSDSISRPARPPQEGDVGTPTPALPQQSFAWDKVTLDLPAGQEAYLQGVYEVDGTFLAIGMGWSEAEGQTMTVWRSTDGTSWQLSDLNGDFTNASVWNVQFNEHGGVAIGEVFQEYSGGESESTFREFARPERVVWTTRDGVNWTRSTLGLTAEPNENVWINTGVAGPDEFVVIGYRETSPELEPIVFEKDGFTITLSEFTFSYQVTDVSGAIVAEGSMDDFYGGFGSEDGQVIADPTTGEVLTVVPWEMWEMAWEAAYSDTSGGPFGGFDYQPPIVTVEQDGYRITVDEEQMTYTVEDVATGALLVSGTADYLWRGPAPIVTDAAGNEILRISWEEFDAAQSAHWEERDYEFDYRATLVVAVSTDGATWTESTVATDAQQVNLDSIIARGDGFLAYGNQYDDYSGGPAVWSSPDGLTWTQVADMPGGMYIWNVQQTPDGTLLALGDGPQGQALWSSRDGIAWGEAFGTRIPEDRNLYEYMNQFGTGELGTVVIGSREQNFYDEEYYSDPLTISKDGYTLTFDDWDWPPRVTVTEDATGEVVVDVRLGLEEGDLLVGDDGEEIIEEAVGLPKGFAWEDGVTTISTNGSVVMMISDDEFFAAQEARWMAIEENYSYEQPQLTMYFSSDLSEWTEIPVDITGWISHVTVGRDAVVLAGEEWVEPPMPLEHEDGFEGDGEDLAWEAPAPVLFVGRPTG